jgi:tetratricopeptide (TPR) repeat protein
VPEARQQLAAALHDYPTSAELHNFLGVVDAQSGNYLLAESNFRKAIELDTRLAGAYLNLGRLYQENRRDDKTAIRKAAQVYQALLQIDPENAEGRYQGAYMLELSGSYQSSLHLLVRLPAEVQQNPQVLAIRCADEAGLGRVTAAAAAAKALSDAPGLQEDDVRIAQPVLASRKQQHLETVLLEALVNRRLASRDSLVRLAALYEQQGRLPQARASLESALAASEKPVPLLLALAQVAYKQQDRRGTLGYLAHARDLEPNNAAIHFFFGIVCVEMDVPIEAEKSLREAVRLSPDNSYYNYALGAVTVQSRKWEAAVPYFQAYARLKPEDPRGRLMLASAYFHAHQEESARKELQIAVRHQETAAEAHLYLGKLALRENDFAVAEAELKRSVDMNPDNPEAFAELGFAYVQREQYPAAEQTLKRSLKLQPDGIRANMVLLTLYQRTGDRHADAQSARVDEVVKKGEESAKALLRTIEIRPF